MHAHVADPDIDPRRFNIERHHISTGVEVECVVEGAGYPVVLLHGFPETKRIWWRNIQSLRDAGFRVIAPDLRGYGGSSLAPDAQYDLASFSDDLAGLLDVLNVPVCAVVGHDLGGCVAIDFALRHAPRAERLCLFNTTAPDLTDEYAVAGIPPDSDAIGRPEYDYARRQGTDPDGLMEELNTAERRCRYIGEFYGHRGWAASSGFSPDHVAFHAAPFADADKLRASFVDYEIVMGRKRAGRPERLSEQVGVPTIILFGPEDRVSSPHFPDRAAIAFPNCVGPFHVGRAGHFLQWERPDVFNGAAVHFFEVLQQRVGLRSSGV